MLSFRHFSLMAACLLVLAAFVAAAPQTVMPTHVLDSMSLDELDDHLQVRCRRGLLRLELYLSAERTQ